LQRNILQIKINNSINFHILLNSMISTEDCEGPVRVFKSSSHPFLVKSSSHPFLVKSSSHPFLVVKQPPILVFLVKSTRQLYFG